jgi:hypothetical protein
MKPRIQTPAPLSDERAWRAADADLTAEIRGLFARCPALDGFSVQAKVLAEGGGAEEELFVTAISIASSVAREGYPAIFEDIASTLKDLLEERPEAHALLRGRTFARALH